MVVGYDARKREKNKMPQLQHFVDLDGLNRELNEINRCVRFPDIVYVEAFCDKKKRRRGKNEK